MIIIIIIIQEGPYTLSSRVTTVTSKSLPSVALTTHSTRTANYWSVRRSDSPLPNNNASSVIRVCNFRCTFHSIWCAIELSRGRCEGVCGNREGTLAPKVGVGVGVGWVGVAIIFNNGADWEMKIGTADGERINTIWAKDKLVINHF